MEKEVFLILDSIFKKSKEFDEYSEWEFIQSIMREMYSCNYYTAKNVISDSYTYQIIDEQKELGRFQRQIVEENISCIDSLIEIGNNLTNFEDITRLRLITYSYITEMKYWQDMIANLLWIQRGKTFYVNPFSRDVLEENLTEKEKVALKQLLNAKNFRDIFSSEKRIKVICFLSDQTGNEALSQLLLSFYDNHLRNSFYHSKYIFSEKGYVGFDKSVDVKLSVDELSTKLDKCIYFYLALIDCIQIYRMTYDKTVTIKGRKASYDDNNDKDSYEIVDIIVVANPRKGIVNTMQTIKNDSSSKEDGDDFINKFIEFSENYDMLIDELNDTELN